MGKTELSYIADGNVSWYNHYENNTKVSQKIKNRAAIACMIQHSHSWAYTQTKL